MQTWILTCQEDLEMENFITLYWLLDHPSDHLLAYLIGYTKSCAFIVDQLNYTRTEIFLFISIDTVMITASQV